MADILGEDFELNLDDILEAEVIPTADPDPANEGGGEPIEDVVPQEPEGNPDDIDLDLAFMSPEDSPEADPKPNPEAKAEEEEEEEIEKSTERTADKGTPSSTIASYASALFEQGAFPDIDEDEIKGVKTAEDLITLNKKQIEANELRDLNPLQKEALEAFRAGIDPESFARAKSNELAYDKIDDAALGDPETSKQILRDYLTMTGTPSDVVDDLVSSYEIDEKLEAKAKEALPKIKQKIKQRSADQLKDAKTQRDTIISDIKTNLDATKEILPGTTISTKERNELFNQMTQPAKILDDGTQLDLVMVKRQEDPVGFMTKLHYYAKLGLFDRKVESEILKTKAKTAALKDFESKFDKGNDSTQLRGGNPNPRGSAMDMFDLDDIPDINPYNK